MPYLTFSALPTGEIPSEGSEPGNNSKFGKTAAPESRSTKSNESFTAGCLDKMLLDAYEGRVHGSRTLDQYYYWSLTDEETKHRDNDQVVTRYLKDKKCETLKLLRVDMLWLWIIDESISYKALRSKSTSH